MKAREIIEALRLNQENFDFSREEFLNLMEKDLLDRVKKLPNFRDYGTPIYKSFKEEVEVSYSIFNEINKILEEEGFKTLRPNLWKAFYALKVSKLRTQMYPTIQAKIEKLKAMKSNYKGKRQNP